MAKRKRRTNADIRLARQRAAVRFSPERSTIKALISDAGARLGSDLSAANAGSKSAVHFANAARKPTTTIFNSARSATDAARQDVEAAFGKLGGAADPFRAATSREQAGAKQRSALARASALNDLTSRTLEAKAAGLSASNQARAGFRQDTRDLGKRLRDLGDRQGNFVAQEAATIAENRANRLVPIRVARIGAKARAKSDAAKARAKAREEKTKFGRDVKLEGIKQSGREKLATTKAKSGGGGGGKGSKPRLLAPGDMGKGLSDLEALYGYAVRARDGKPFVGGHTRQAPLGRGGANRKISSKVAAPQTPALKEAALDAAYAGYLRPSTVRALRRAGYRIADVKHVLRTSTKRPPAQRYATSRT